MGRLTEEQKAQIPILYEELGTYTKVAERLGISASTVAKYVKKYQEENVTDKPSTPIPKSSKPAEPRQRTKITPELIEEINNRYACCGNMAQVARELNISNTTVKRYLNEENQNKNNTKYDDRDALYFYIVHLFGKKPISSWNLTQMEKFKRQGINYKAQLLTLKYFYEIEKNSVDKANGSIGIIPFVVNQASNYFLNQKQKRIEIEEGIKAQLEKDRLEIKYNPKSYWSNPRKKPKQIDLSKIEKGDD